MKRIIAAIILLVTVLVLTVTGNLIIISKCDGIKEKLDICTEEFESGKESAAQSAKSLIKEFKEKETILTLFANHSLIDQISNEITALPVYVKENNRTEFYACREKIARTLNQIKEEQRFGIQSFY